MKKSNIVLLLVLVGFGVAAYLVHRRSQERRAERALVASFCSREPVTLRIQRVFERAKEAKNESEQEFASATYYGQMQVEDAFKGSTLAPHLPALRRFAGEPTNDSHARIERLANEVSAQCPNVFPTPVRAALPIAFVIEAAPAA